MLLRRRHGNPYTRILPITGSLRDVHAARAEQWFGKEAYERLCMVNHYYPIPVAGAEGPVYAYKGALVGPTRMGRMASYTDKCWDEAKRRLRRAGKSHATLGTGFASLSDLISEATTGGKQQMRHFTKAGVAAAVVGVTYSLARFGPDPTGQVTAAAFAAGESTTNTTPAGLGLSQDNAGGGDTLHFLSGVVSANIASQLLMVYDRFYQGNHTMTVDPQAVTGTPTRYQDTTARGNFIAGEVSTVFPAANTTIAHTYVDQDGNVAEVITSTISTVNSSIVNRWPHATPDWHYRLNAGDTGVRALTNINLGAALASGAMNVYLGKPLILIPTVATAYTPAIFDGLNQTFNLALIPVDACLALAQMFPSAASITNWTGMFCMVSG